ncbi:hypothetical protein [Streptomyces kanasensis]|uniref:Uncharacterized protein n=1 Tax=Streptomyces kanasensis TaxID=936756 RepID=A0A100Y5X4_9ACTN|nr:hypothetical protein [Streptomyces kanasensis]KUH38250.1 hypothetical protein ATE80_13765 [Streptomyces kanasensis]
MAFALAANDAVTVATDLLRGRGAVTGADEDEAFRAMIRAFAVVSAEGPPPLIEHGEQVVHIVSFISESASLHHQDLVDGTAEPGDGWGEEVHSCVHDFSREVHAFREAVRAFLETPPTALGNIGTAVGVENDHGPGCECADPVPVLAAGLARTPVGGTSPLHPCGWR